MVGRGVKFTTRVVVVKSRLTGGVHIGTLFLSFLSLLQEQQPFFSFFFQTTDGGKGLGERVTRRKLERRITCA